MMSLEVIDRLADETGEYAKELGKEPYFIQFAWEKEDWPPFPFPNLGSYCPEGWEEVDRLFVDKLGNYEQDSEMAAYGCHGIRQLVEWCEVGYGYAIVLEGEFQMYVGKFRKGIA